MPNEQNNDSLEAIVRSAEAKLEKLENERNAIAQEIARRRGEMERITRALEAMRELEEQIHSNG